MGPTLGIHILEEIKIFDWFFRALKSPQIQFSQCLPYLALFIMLLENERPKFW